MNYRAYRAAFLIKYYKSNVVYLDGKTIKDRRYDPEIEDVDLVDLANPRKHRIVHWDINIGVLKLETVDNTEEPKETLTIPDIRNKLGAITNILKLLDDRNYPSLLDRVDPDGGLLNQAKREVNYLAQREVFELFEK